MIQTYKHATFANEVSSSTSRGSPFTGYVNQGVKWQGELSDAALDEMLWASVVDVRMLEEGNAQYIVNKRKYFDRASTYSFDETEPTEADISNYGTNLIDAVVIQPAPQYKLARVTRFGNRVNRRDLLKDKMDELSFGFADLVDSYISEQISTKAAMTTSTVAGAMVIYGGNATADSELTSTDTLSIELINQADALMRGKYAYYWSSGVFTKSSGTKNPWQNTVSEPYVLMIGPNQLKALRGSSQFTNAAEYGSDSVISTGRILDYLGTKIIVSNNIYSVAAAGSAPDGGSAPSVDMTRCVFMKAKKAFTLVWGEKPSFVKFDIHERDQEAVKVRGDFAGKVIHDDSIIYIDVAD